MRERKVRHMVRRLVVECVVRNVNNGQLKYTTVLFDRVTLECDVIKREIRKQLTGGEYVLQYIAKIVEESYLVTMPLLKFLEHGEIISENKNVREL